MDGLKNFIKSNIRVYIYDADAKCLRIKGLNISDNDIIREMISLVTFLEENNILYRVEKDFRVQLYIPDDEKKVLVELDKNGNIVYLNEYVSSLTGYSVAEVLDRSWFDIFIPDDEKDRISKVHKSMLADESQAWSCMNTIIAKDKTRIMVEWKNLLIMNADGSVEKTFSMGTVK